jgi:transposase-like protein
MAATRKKRPNYKPAMTLPELCEQFQSEEKCREYLIALRWPDGVTCPRCQSKKVSHIATRDQFDCDSCRYQFSVRAGTIFHDSHLPLWKWFLATYLMSEARKGVSANQLKRTLKVSYKTAWYLCHRIREALKDDKPSLLRGVIEVDETWVGGRNRGRGRRNKLANKTMVLGAIERGGPVRMKVAGRPDRETLHGFVNETAERSAMVMTDQWQAYEGLTNPRRSHHTVNHSKDEWTRKDAWVESLIHTNTVESAFSLFKRSVVGAYHHLSAKHMDRYLDEFEFRFNNRTNPHLFRDALRKLLASDSLPYQTLVSVTANDRGAA